jgi:hypothetical protein
MEEDAKDLDGGEPPTDATETPAAAAPFRPSEMHDLGESAYGRRKEIGVFMDDDEGNFCDRCRRLVRVPMLTMDGSSGEYGGPCVCETCVFELFVLMREYNEIDKAREAAKAESM